MRFFLGILLVFAFQVVMAQDSSLVVQQTSKPKKIKYDFSRVRFMIGMDYGYISPIITERDHFNDSYYPVADSAPVWVNRNTTTNFYTTNKIGNIQFWLTANFWNNLYMGMSYQFFTIKQYKKDKNMGNLLSTRSSMFFLVSARFSYVFELLKNKCLQIEPALKIGGYTADDYYDRGLGKKFYMGADVRIRYLIKKKFGFSVGMDYDYIRYKRSGTNALFQQDYNQKTTFNNLHFNVGICGNITINTRKK